MRGHGLTKETVEHAKQAPKKVRKDNTKKKETKEKLPIKRVLNIGWGGVPIGIQEEPGYETKIYNLDKLNYVTDQGHKTDYITDARTLEGVESKHFNAICANHILEHFHHFELEDVLQNWKRVLIPGGGLLIEVPNGPWVLQNMEGDLLRPLYRTPAGDDIRALDMIYGFQKDIQQGLTGMEHKNLFDSTSLYNVLKKAGFVQIEISLKDEFRGSLIARAFKPTKEETDPSEGTLVTEFKRNKESG